MAKRIYLVGKRGAGKYAIVDDEDFEWLSQYSWTLDAHGYAQRRVRGNGTNGTVKMHREIMQAPPNLDVDHTFGIKLDNRKSQLRLCTEEQNCWNTAFIPGISGWVGVTWHKVAKKWRAKICHQGKWLHLGLFDDKDEAARAYNKKALELRGEFAKLNPVI